MSVHSHEHHVHASQSVVLALMERFFLDEQGCLAFDLTSLPQGEEERGDLIKSLYRFPYRSFYLVSPTDAQGWTILWSLGGQVYDAELLAFLSGRLCTTALYGYDNDQTDYWHWMHFQCGEEAASYLYVGSEDQRWVRWGHEPRPPGAMTVSEAFAAQGRTYHHLSLSLAMRVGWGTTALPFEQFRFISITGAPR